ncbi:unnamed protein product [Pleuronectes platessa]|uniref:Uncharacterized protein n=1 Tax=Pleuronectes platessa TaxID=8262 RepID=A0A9N7YJS0_PLEPL|nr:unnamed protein product [Pleuronectes platessa]
MSTYHPSRRCADGHSSQALGDDSQPFKTPHYRQAAQISWEKNCVFEQQLEISAEPGSPKQEVAKQEVTSPEVKSQSCAVCSGSEASVLMVQSEIPHMVTRLLDESYMAVSLLPALRYN